jgi:hypothetical protein
MPSTLRGSRRSRPTPGHASSFEGGPSVRGAKAWAWLAYLLLAEGRVERRRLASLLFPDAADPAASLRWNLSQLRRGLGIALDGDPLTLTLPGDSWVDLVVLAHGGSAEAAAVALGEQGLLAGVAGAAEDPDRSVAAGRTASWRAFVPLPQTLRAEVAHRGGEIDHASSILGVAHATSLQVGDPCWESMALRGLGLARTARGAVDEGLGLLQDAPRQCPGCRHRPARGRVETLRR